MRSPRPYIPYDIPLAEGERARLVLPQDLSEAEAERVCGVIRTLAFSAAELEAAKASDSFGALMAEWAAMEDEGSWAP